MKTVVTGGAGFIGSHLVKRLLDDGRDVVVADDFSRGSRLNLLDLGVELDCECVDLRDYSQSLKVLDGAMWFITWPRAHGVFKMLKKNSFMQACSLSDLRLAHV